jgi:Ca-activated chloride channel family protein
MHNSNLFISIFCLTLYFCGISQTEKIILRKGNDAYFGGKPLEATNYYSKSLKEKPDYFKANFNLGDALYKTAELIKAGKIAPPNKKMTPDSAANLVYDQAAQQFEVVAKSVSNADTIQRAWHNYGNSKLKQKSFEDAILGYKKALKLNPKDEDTRYNLAYAQRELKKQQDQQKKNEKKDDKKKEGEKPEDKKDKGEKDKEDINNKNDKDKQEAQQPQMSKEQAEKMLNALKNSEKKMQSLRKKKGDSGEKIKVEKDW